MKRKSFALMLVFLFTVSLFLTSCAGGEATTQTTETESAPGETTPVQETSTEDVTDDLSADLTMWTGTWNEGKMEQLLEQFQETYPNINVHFEYGPWDGMEDKYMAAMQANAIPEIIDIAIAWTIPYARMGNLIAIDDYADKWGVDLATRYYPGGLETAQMDGQHYALPYRTEVFTLFYNKNLFEQAGLDPEKAPETWDDVVEYAGKIDALGEGIYGYGLSGSNAGNTTAQIYSLMFSNGVELLNSDHSAAAFNTSEGVEALEFWANMHIKENIVPSSVLENDNTVNRNYFSEEKLGIYLSGSYDLPAIYEANPDIEMGFGLFPQFSDYPVRVQQGGWNIAITSQTQEDERDAAFLWISFLASPDVSVIFSDTFSACQEAADDPAYSDPNLDKFIEALQFGKPLPGNINMNGITTIMYNEAQAVLSGSKDAATALSDAEIKTNELLSN